MTGFARTIIAAGGLAAAATHVALAQPPSGTLPPDPDVSPAAPAGATPAPNTTPSTPASDATPPAPDAAPPAPTPDAAAGTPQAPADAGWGDPGSFGAGADIPTFQTRIYGFIDFHLEKVARTPDSIDSNGGTVYARNPLELDVPNLNVMVQGAIREQYRYYLNLAAPGSGSNSDDESLIVRNAWIELPIVRSYLNLRVGKTYRRFGLYNEILDAVPTFIGIEPPELFDKDHLLLTRTTSIMVHGQAEAGPATINYSVTTGNDERDDKAIPIGADVYIDLPEGLRLGSSFYTTGGDAVPSRAVGDGSPRGGVADWMTHDRFLIVGGYAQLERQNLVLQAEFWDAKHDGERDPDALAVLAAEGNLNRKQLARLFEGGDPAGTPITEVNYHVRTFYARGGYTIPFGTRASITPYGQLDYYSNPETINNKSLGGDNEAGLSDDGKFTKFTLGMVLRPLPQVALKVDASGHLQNFNQRSEFYPEIRFSLSYLWELDR